MNWHDTDPRLPYVTRDLLSDSSLGAQSKAGRTQAWAVKLCWESGEVCFCDDVALSLSLDGCDVKDLP